MSNKYNENKRQFNCDKSLWEEFGEEVEKDNCFKNRSEAIRFFIIDYVKNRRQERKDCKK